MMGWNPTEWESDDDLENPKGVGRERRRAKKSPTRGKRRVAREYCKTGKRYCGPVLHKIRCQRTSFGAKVRCDWMLDAQDGGRWSMRFHHAKAPWGYTHPTEWDGVGLDWVGFKSIRLGRPQEITESNQRDHLWDCGGGAVGGAELVIVLGTT